MPDIIREFVEEHEGIEISLIIENTANIEKLILENKVDFAFVEGRIHSEEIKTETIWKDEIVFISSDNHPWSEKEIITPKDLEKQKLIMREEGSGTREIVEGYLRDKGVDFKIFMELGNTEAIKKSVEAKLGVGCLSIRCVQDRIEKGKLHAVRLNKGKIQRDLLLIIHKDKFINNNMKEFISFTNR